MNYERQAQEAADLTRLPHFVITFASGYRTLTTQPGAWINLGGEVKSVEQFTPVKPHINWLRVFVFAGVILWSLLVWAAVIEFVMRVL